jgi:4-alpha-glucanotransferase
VPRFGAYLWGEDIDDREETGALTSEDAARERAERAAWRARLLRETGAAPDASGPEATAQARDRCLAHLARSEAALVLVDLEELWDERRSQNQPGTGPENGNWRMRSARTLEEIQGDLRLAELLAEIDRERRS